MNAKINEAGNLSENRFPSFAMDFRDDKYTVPVKSSLVLFLPQTEFRPEPVRVTRRDGSNGTWFEVELYSGSEGPWVEQKSHAEEHAAVQDAKNWYPDPEDPMSRQSKSPVDQKMQHAQSPVTAFERKVNEALDAAKGLKVIFSSMLQDRSAENAVYHSHSGQQAAIIGVGINPGQEGDWDEEALPFIRVRFDDGVEITAFGEELFSDDARFLALYTAVLCGYGAAREFDACYVGPYHLEAEGSVEDKQEYLQKLDALQPVTHCDQQPWTPAEFRVPPAIQGGERKEVGSQAKVIAPKTYRITVSGGRELDNSPSVAIFEINEVSAKEIVKLAGLVKANDLHKVERFDYRADYLQHDPETSPEDAEDVGEENSVRTECDVLVVSDGEFYFRAYVKHTDVAVRCESQSIAELAAHFRIQLGDSLASQANSHSLSM